MLLVKNIQNYPIIVNKVLNLIVCNSELIAATNCSIYFKKINK